MAEHGIKDTAKKHTKDLQKWVISRGQKKLSQYMLGIQNKEMALKLETKKEGYLQSIEKDLNSNFSDTDMSLFSNKIFPEAFKELKEKVINEYQSVVQVKDDGEIVASDEPEAETVVEPEAEVIEAEKADKVEEEEPEEAEVVKA